MHEIESLSELDQWLASSTDPIAAAVQGLDLSSRSSELISRNLDGSLFLSCQLEEQAITHLLKVGAYVFPTLDGFKFSLHRSKLYCPLELFEGFDPSDLDGYKSTFDYAVYEEYLTQGKADPGSIRVSLARRLHDHSISDALKEELDGRQVVAIMGGHGMERGDPFYLEVALISRALTIDGYLMISGGGPGAMEATHLGAYFAARKEQELIDAINEIKVRPRGVAPGREYKDKDWLHRAWKIFHKYPLSKSDEAKCKSIGIPTWLYGHEPPTIFATHLAKYFANSVREDGLLMVASHGVIFAPGSAGTTQEIFQDAAQNHYGTSGYYSPMILLGVDHWTNNRPVWPLLSAVSKEKTYGQLVELTDNRDKIVGKIKSYNQDLYKKQL